MLQIPQSAKLPLRKRSAPIISPTFRLHFLSTIGCIDLFRADFDFKSAQFQKQSNGGYAEIRSVSIFPVP
jgi:hypothetical protein